MFYKFLSHDTSFVWFCGVIESYSCFVFKYGYQYQSWQSQSIEYYAQCSTTYLVKSAGLINEGKIIQHHDNDVQIKLFLHLRAFNAMRNVETNYGNLERIPQLGYSLLWNITNITGFGQHLARDFNKLSSYIII